MSIDPKCYDLAEAWLTDQPEATAGQIAELAQLIQDTVELYCEDKFPEAPSAA